MDTATIFLFWVILSILAGAYASSKSVKGGFLGGLLVSLIFSPIIGFFIIAISRPDKKVIERKALKSGMKKCPDCAEIISKEAIKCKHCGKIFE